MAKYKKVLGTKIVKYENEFFISFKRSVFRVNEVGARVFDLCNGVNTKDHIIKKLSMFYEISEEEISNDITDYLNELDNQQLIKQIE